MNLPLFYPYWEHIEYPSDLTVDNSLVHTDFFDFFLFSVENHAHLSLGSIFSKTPLLYHMFF